MNRWLFLWRRLQKELWVRATAYAAAAAAAALLAGLGEGSVPESVAERLGGESVEQILTILASSMLAVATFSVGAMVNAYTAVSQGASPRVAALVTGDDQTQKSLATFVGAFLYSIVAVTALQAGYYGQGGRAILFLASLLIVGLVAYRLLAWINRLSRLARVSHMVEMVETEAREALCERRWSARLGGRSGSLGEGQAIESKATGYVQNVDPKRLQELAEEYDCEVEVLATPGAFLMRDDALARLSLPAAEAEVRERFRSAFVVGDSRSFEQDPRYGLTVLGEIAARALSPGVNDPGTAIEVISAGVRLLDQWVAAPEDPPDAPAHPRVLVPSVAPDDLLDDVMGPPARYGAGDLPVAIRLQKACRALGAREPFRVPATRLAIDALARSREALPIPADVARLERHAYVGPTDVEGTPPRARR